MFRKYSYRFLFIAIILLAFVLRVWNLNTVPPGPNRDEAAIGYNAYSLLHTARDEYGRFLPISFQSFGDWKLPVYIYLTVLSVKIFGLTSFAIRLPSAIFGTISVVLAFFLIKQLFAERKDGLRFLPLLTMALMTISPWSVHLSRTTSEANVAMCMLSAAVLVFLKNIEKRNWLLIFSGILFALTFGTYASNFVFTSLLTLTLAFLYRKELIKHPYGIVTILIFIFMSSFLWWQTSGANITKISGINIFSDPSIVHERIEIPRNEYANPHGLAAKFFNNKFWLGVERFSQNYLNTFSPDFLFIKGGGNHAHNIAYVGNMYLIEAPFFFAGLAWLFVNRKKRSEYLVIFWLLLSPIAASLTKDAPHTVRLFVFFPILPLITAFGIIWIIRSFPQISRRLAITVLIILFIGNLFFYLDRYYVHFPYEESQNWGMLYQKLNTVIFAKQFGGKKIVMSEPDTSPYIYFLFYQKYDPKLYQQQAIRYPMTAEGFVHVKGYDRFTFRDIRWSEDASTSNVLIISKAKDVPPDIRKQYKTTDILLPSGDPWFTIVEGGEDRPI